MVGLVCSVGWVIDQLDVWSFGLHTDLAAACVSVVARVQAAVPVISRDHASLRLILKRLAREGGRERERERERETERCESGRRGKTGKCNRETNKTSHEAPPPSFVRPDISHRFNIHI